MRMYPELEKYMANVLADAAPIDAERKEVLNEIVMFMNEELAASRPVQLTFICTHNSRRSHFAQVWAAVAAAHFGIDNVVTYSGGTAATAFNPRAVAALERAGFRIENPGGENPHYVVRFSDEAEPLICFSKKYDDAYNPQKDFVAIMTCSEADRNCPFVSGAVARFATPYVDPKEADNTSQEAIKYDERCKQIATEMFNLINRVKA